MPAAIEAQNAVHPRQLHKYLRRITVFMKMTVVPCVAACHLIAWVTKLHNCKQVSKGSGWHSKRRQMQSSVTKLQESLLSPQGWLQCPSSQGRAEWPPWHALQICSCNSLAAAAGRPPLCLLSDGSSDVTPWSIRGLPLTPHGAGFFFPPPLFLILFLFLILILYWPVITALGTGVCSGV